MLKARLPFSYVHYNSTFSLSKGMQVSIIVLVSSADPALISTVAYPVVLLFAGILALFVIRRQRTGVKPHCAIITKAFNRGGSTTIVRVAAALTDLFIFVRRSKEKQSSG